MDELQCFILSEVIHEDVIMIVLQNTYTKIIFLQYINFSVFEQKSGCIK